jgi:type II restriction enzyme
MKFAPIFKSALKCSTPDEVFEYFMHNLNDSIRYWDYFVNWAKVVGKTKELEIDLNTLNYLVGKDDVEKAFKELLNQNGRLARLIPVLLACRECDFKILTDFTAGVLSYESFAFKPKEKLTDGEIDQACRFASETGLLEMFKTRIIKSVPDYVIGVEVGLDTNGRKNRGGTAMETVVENLLRPICEKNHLAMMSQATASKLKAQWNITLNRVDADRGFDFAVKRGTDLFIIETNYYNGSGTKLKSVAGEFQVLSTAIKAQGADFIWITDGLGWHTCEEQFRAAFNQIDYTLNIDMILKGVLDGIFNGKS